MPASDTWDWPFLFYAGTALLNMRPAEFWRSTPKRLCALIHVHADLKKEKEEPQEKTAYIDQVF